MQRILIVDDERIIADTLSLIFRRNGFEVRTAYSADEALRSAQEFQPELLLCDISMPGRDGIELMKDMVRDHPGCRILVLTGFSGNYQRVQDEVGFSTGVADVLLKPCQPSELLRTAGAMLRRA